MTSTEEKFIVAKHIPQLIRLIEIQDLKFCPSQHIFGCSPHTVSSRTRSVWGQDALGWLTSITSAGVRRWYNWEQNQFNRLCYKRVAWQNTHGYTTEIKRHVCEHQAEQTEPLLISSREQSLCPTATGHGLSPRSTLSFCSADRRTWP